MATLQDLRQDLFELVARNTELDPSTIDGAEILDRYLSRAYSFMLGLRLPRGGKLSSSLAQVRSSLLDLNPLTGTAQAGSNGSVTLDSGFSASYSLNGWVCSITSGTGIGQKRVVTDYNDTTKELTVYPDWTIVPDSSSEYSLSTRRIPIVRSSSTQPFSFSPEPSPESLQDIFQVFLISSLGETRIELERVNQIEESSRIDLGDPSSYVFTNGMIYLDRAPKDRILLELSYRSVPSFPSIETEEIPLPVPFEQLLILLARWWILVRYGELQDAYAAKKDFYDFLGTLAQPGEDSADWTESWTIRLY